MPQDVKSFLLYGSNFDYILFTVSYIKLKKLHSIKCIFRTRLGLLKMAGKSGLFPLIDFNNYQPA